MIDKDNTLKRLQSFPSPFVRVLTQEYYDAGHSDYTITQILGPPRRTGLKSEGHQEIVRSVYAGMVAMWGTAMHWILEQGSRKEEGEHTEVRNFHTMTIDGDDVVVSGCMDLWEKKIAWDYKFIKGFQEKMKPEHYDQIQLNAWLAIKNGWEVENVGICYTDKTWSPGQADVNPAYPQMPCQVYIHPYDAEYAERLIIERVTDHHRARKGSPRDCRPTEQWAEPDVWALKNPGAGKARKKCYSLTEAYEEMKKGEIIEKRPGLKKYCTSWCGLKYCCPQYEREERERVTSQED